MSGIDRTFGTRALQQAGSNTINRLGGIIGQWQKTQDNDQFVLGVGLLSDRIRDNMNSFKGDKEYGTYVDRWQTEYERLMTMEDVDMALGGKLSGTARQQLENYWVTQQDGQRLTVETMANTAGVEVGRVNLIDAADNVLARTPYPLATPIQDIEQRRGQLTTLFDFSTDNQQDVMQTGGIENERGSMLSNEVYTEENNYALYTPTQAAELKAQYIGQLEGNAAREYTKGISKILMGMTGAEDSLFTTQEVERLITGMIESDEDTLEQLRGMDNLAINQILDAYETIDLNDDLKKAMSTNSVNDITREENRQREETAAKIGAENNVVQDIYWGPEWRSLLDKNSDGEWGLDLLMPNAPADMISQWKSNLTSRANAVKTGGLYSQYELDVKKQALQGHFVALALAGYDEDTVRSQLASWASTPEYVMLATWIPGAYEDVAKMGPSDKINNEFYKLGIDTIEKANLGLREGRAKAAYMAQTSDPTRNIQDEEYATIAASIAFAFHKDFALPTILDFPDPDRGRNTNRVTGDEDFVANALAMKWQGLNEDVMGDLYGKNMQNIMGYLVQKYEKDGLDIFDKQKRSTVIPGEWEEGNPVFYALSESLDGTKQRTKLRYYMPFEIVGYDENSLPIIEYPDDVTKEMSLEFVGEDGRWHPAEKLTITGGIVTNRETLIPQLMNPGYEAPAIPDKVVISHTGQPADVGIGSLKAGEGLGANILAAAAGSPMGGMITAAALAEKSYDLADYIREGPGQFKTKDGKSVSHEIRQILEQQFQETVPTRTVRGQ